MRQRGLSLAELMMVVALLGIVAVVAIPGLSSSNPQRLDEASGEVVQALRFARAQAQLMQQDYGVTLRPAPAGLAVFRVDTSGALPALVYDVIHPVDRHPYDITLDAPPYAPGTALSADFRYAAGGTASATVAFDPSGAPVDPNTGAPLFQTGTVTVTLGDLARTVSVAPVTGRVVLQ